MYEPACRTGDRTGSLFTTKAPFQFPINFREGFVKYWPIVSLVLLLIAVPAILAFLGIGAAFLPVSFMGGVGAGFAYTIVMVLSAIRLVLGAMALPGLFDRKRSGWVLSYLCTAAQCFNQYPFV